MAELSLFPGLPLVNSDETRGKIVLDTKAIRENLSSMGLSQNKFAERAGVDSAHMSRIMTGAILPTLPTLMKMGDALGTNPTTWLVWVEDASAA